MTRAELIEGVRAHALKHYEEDGWDYVVETYSDDDIVAEAGDAKTLAGAIRKIGKMVGILDDRRQDVVAEIF